MFYDCKRLKNPNLSNWDVSKVTDMGSMFSGCEELKTLNAVKWDTTNVSYCGRMFSNCPDDFVLTYGSESKNLVEQNIGELFADYSEDSKYYFGKYGPLTREELENYIQGNQAGAISKSPIAIPDDSDTPSPVVPKPVQPESSSMYRLYNPNSGEHFYTYAEAERDNLIRLGWKDEGEGWKSPRKSKTPVYRLYNPNSGDHHYTMNAAEKNMLVSLGWKDEGIGLYSDDAKGQPIYRQYNPNAQAGSHNYTLSKAENNLLVSLGWQEEGIAWYAIK